MKECRIWRGEEKASSWDMARERQRDAMYNALFSDKSCSFSVLLFDSRPPPSQHAFVSWDNTQLALPDAFTLMDAVHQCRASINLPHCASRHSSCVCFFPLPFRLKIHFYSRPFILLFSPRVSPFRHFFPFCFLSRFRTTGRWCLIFFSFLIFFSLLVSFFPLFRKSSEFIRGEKDSIGLKCRWALIAW